MLSRRVLSSFARAKAVRCHAFGKPIENIKLDDVPDPAAPKGSEVVVEMHAVSINERDHTTLRGYFGHSEKLPQTVGFEGVGKIVAAGPDVKKAKVGTFVVPRTYKKGTFATSIIGKEEEFTSVDQKLGRDNLAVIGVGPTTAYRMLHDYVDINPGDCIIHSMASEPTGTSVAQMAANKGAKVISVVYDSSPKELVEKLKSHGSTVVVEESYLRTPEYWDLVSDLPTPKLALDGAGSKVAVNLARLLKPGGTLVCYESFTRGPVTFPPSLFLHNNIHVTGFSLENWIATHSAEEHEKMLGEVSKMVLEGRVKLFGEVFPLKGWYQAFQRSLDHYQFRIDGKVIIDMKG